MAVPAPFWKFKTLAQMTESEWESLCDGCGQCCLNKLEDEDTGEIGLTNVACRLLDVNECLCTDYANRLAKVPDCIRLTPQKINKTPWLPTTCAYRLLAEGKELHWWHHLVSGDPNTVHEAGISVRGTIISEDNVDDLEDHVHKWLNSGAKPFRQHN